MSAAMFVVDPKALLLHSTKRSGLKDKSESENESCIQNVECDNQEKVEEAVNVVSIALGSTSELECLCVLTSSDDVHICTYAFSDDDKTSSKISTVGLPAGSYPQTAAWNMTCKVLVVGDKAGKLHFIDTLGNVLFSQQLIPPGAGGLSCISFDGRPLTPAIATSPLEIIEELVVVAKSGKMFHFSNLKLGRVLSAYETGNLAELKTLRAQLRVSTTDTNLTHQPTALHVLWHPKATVVVLGASTLSNSSSQKSGGDVLSFWKMERSTTDDDNDKTKQLRLVDTLDAELLSESCSHPVSIRKLVPCLSSGSSHMEIPGSCYARHICGIGSEWFLILDDEGCLSWWDAPSMLRIARFNENILFLFFRTTTT
eukprot:g51.t1